MELHHQKFTTNHPRRRQHGVRGRGRLDWSMESITAAHRAINGDHQSTLGPIFVLMRSPVYTWTTEPPRLLHLRSTQKKTISGVAAPRLGTSIMNKRIIFNFLGLCGVIEILFFIRFL